ncbi:MAG: hypothetical protein Q9177_005620 [Variospora cf. flavescens]
MSAPQYNKFIPHASGTPSSSRAASTPLPEIHVDRLPTTNNTRPNPPELRPLPRKTPAKGPENARLELELEEQERKTEKVSDDWRLKHRELGALRKQLDVKDEEAFRMGIRRSIFDDQGTLEFENAK